MFFGEDVDAHRAFQSIGEDEKDNKKNKGDEGDGEDSRCDSPGNSCRFPAMNFYLLCLFTSVASHQDNEIETDKEKGDNPAKIHRVFLKRAACADTFDQLLALFFGEAIQRIDPKLLKHRVGVGVDLQFFKVIQLFLFFIHGFSYIQILFVRPLR